MKLFTLIALLLLGSSAWAAGTKNIAGYVGETTGGSAFAFNKLGQKRKLEAKEPIFEGETLITSEKAKSSVIFTDGTLVELNPATQFRVEEFKFGEEVEKPNAVFRMLKGGFRFVSGLVNKKGGNLSFRTATATIGVRGSAGSLSEDGTIEVYEGTFDVAPPSGGKGTTLVQGETANTSSGSVKRTEKLTRAQIQSRVNILKANQSFFQDAIAGLKSVDGNTSAGEELVNEFAEEIKKGEDLLNQFDSLSNIGGGSDASTEAAEEAEEAAIAATCEEGQVVSGGVCVSGGGDTDTETASEASEGEA